MSFDLNASHDFGETNSVVSCPSLRSAIRNPSKSLKPNSFAGLAITDSRKSLRTLKGSWCDQLNHIPRSRTLSPERLAGSRLRSRSAGPGSRQQPSSPLSETSTSTVRPSQLSSAYSRTESPDRSSESTHSLLHSYLPKCLSADIVIECAQDRLVELQNQVVEAYRARAEVTQALDDQRRYFVFWFGCSQRKFSFHEILMIRIGWWVKLGVWPYRINGATEIKVFILVLLLWPSTPYFHDNAW